MIKSEQFHLPGAKEIQSGRMEIGIILVDAAEQPIERPQKNSGRHDFPLSKESGA
ncbi:hypothetical protein VU07_04275 [Desulfobulbus sp. F4]|nr:hypothetical protein [Desulfobulbus sp. F3]MCW5201001.1 hypothetical protein [Desulfobulbus sp. F4]